MDYTEWSNYFAKTENEKADLECFQDLQICYV